MGYLINYPLVVTRRSDNFNDAKAGTKCSDKTQL